MMKMNGYSLPVQVFSVKKNSSLTRLKISLNDLARDFDGYSKCANWSPVRSNSRRSNAANIRCSKPDCAPARDKRHRLLPARQQVANMTICPFCTIAKPHTVSLFRSKISVGGSLACCEVAKSVQHAPTPAPRQLDSLTIDIFRHQRLESALNKGTAIVGEFLHL